eukprot:Lithocolla_globosa_v1_NODE_2926_length_1821_cov_8.480747.p1 type:complete len:548 gc:universal NODE_2926_length_1821_cov_8.480747:1819-176(-)
MDVVEATKLADHGDLGIPIPKLRKYKIEGNPNEIAQNWAKQFQVDDFIIKVQPFGAFLNFFINQKKLLERTLKLVFEKGDKYGRAQEKNGKKIVVEYSSPNIAKPFHAGHLRSTIIGNFLANLHDAMGYETVRINYLGDWGKQYGLLAVGFEKFGVEEELERDPIKHLFHVYVNINQEATEHPEIHDQARAYFKKMEDGDEKYLGLWKRFRDLSITKYKEMYSRLNVEFDVYSGESMYDGLMQKELERLKEKQLLKQDDGAWISDLEKYKCGKCVVQKKDGSTLYITRDLAAAHDRQDSYHFDHMYYVVSAQQELHFKQLFKMLDLMDYGDWTKKMTHVPFGMVTGMSTRKGNVVFLEQIMELAFEKMLEQMKTNEEKYKQMSDPIGTAKLVALSAIVIQDMSARRIKDYAFIWERMLSFEGDTGPYIQFAHARLCSIERKALETMKIKVTTDINYSLLEGKEVTALIQKVAQFPDVIKLAFSQLEPNTIVSYAMSLSHNVSSTLEVMWVMGQEEEVAKARLLLYWAARVTLGCCLRMVGLIPLERM